MRSLLCSVTLFLASTAYGAIGPNAKVFVENKIISPDGFSRSYVNFLFGSVLGWFIKYNKLAPYWPDLSPVLRHFQGL